MLKLKLWYFGHLRWRADSLEKTLMLGKMEDRRRRGQQKDEMVRQHHYLNGHEFDQVPGDGEGQGSLACCGPWFCKELDTTERQSNNKVTFMFHHEFMFSLSNSETLRGSHPTIHRAMTCSKNLFLTHLPTQLLLKRLNLEEDGGEEWKMVKYLWCLGWKHAEFVSCKLLL